MSNCSHCQYIGGCPYREEGSCSGRLGELEAIAQRAAMQPSTPRTLTEEDVRRIIREELREYLTKTKT